MKRESTKAVLLILAMMLIIAGALYFLINNRNQADTNADSITYRGKVYLGNTSGAPAPGANVILVTDSDICKVKKYSTTADSEGLFSITINKPFCSCPYRVIAGGNGDYNAVDNGGVTLNNKEPMPGVDNSSALLRTNKTTQAMHSAYFGSVYTNDNNGYYGSFHLSQWDTHFLRNKVTADQITQPQAPSSAHFTLSIRDFTPTYNFGPDEPGAAMGEKINVVLSAYAMGNDAWTRDYTRPTVSGALDSKKITLDTATGEITGDDLNFSLDLGSLSKDQRYAVWLSGFMVTFQFGEGDTQTTMGWQNINPDIHLPLDPPTIGYSGFEKVTNNSAQLSVTSDPVPSRTITCDYGYRKIGQGCHDGIDLSAADDTTVRSVADGIVESFGSIGGYGKCLTIKHCGNMQSRYCHLASANVSPGEYVTGGQAVAKADTTGTQAAHLHFMIMKDGTPYDPWYWFQGYSQSVQHLCSNKGGTIGDRRNNLQDSCVTNRGWEIGY